MNREKKIQLALWAIFSICTSAVLSFFASLVFWFFTMDLHKTTSAPGDFAEADASMILSDIEVNLAIAFIFVSIIAWIGYKITQFLIKDFSSPLNHRQVSKFLYVLLAFNLILLCAGLLYTSVAYWQQRAPYFPK
jgi:hypothetical protein